jgi:condensin complex subunit 1
MENSIKNIESKLPDITTLAGLGNHVPGHSSEASTSEEKQLKSLYANILKENLPATHEFGEVVFKAFDSQKREALDQQNRECNIIIYRAKESRSKNTEEKRLHDQHFVDEFFSNILDLDIETKEIARLGKPEENKDRPLRVSLKNKEDTRAVHESARKLRDATETHFKNIAISHDLTVNQRDELKTLLQEAKSKNEEQKEGPWEYKVRSKGHQWLPKIMRLRRREQTLPTQNKARTSVSQQGSTTTPKEVATTEMVSHPSAAVPNQE